MFNATRSSEVSASTVRASIAPVFSLLDAALDVNFLMQGIVSAFALLFLLCCPLWFSNACQWRASLPELLATYITSSL